MFDCFLSQILVLALLFASSARILFIKHARIDCFATFTPFAFIISLFNFYLFDFSVLNVVVFLIAFIGLLANFRSVLRLHANLLVDHYNTGFLVATALTSLLALSTLFFIVLFRPVKLVPQDFNVQKTVLSYCGRTTDELKLQKEFLSSERSSAKIFIYEPKTDSETSEDKKKPVVLFASSSRGASYNYEPYFLFLAQKGFAVVSADFYTKDTRIFKDYAPKGFLSKIADSKQLRRVFSLYVESTSKENFEAVLKTEMKLAEKKYNSLTKIALDYFGNDSRIFYVVDGIDFDTIYAAVDANPQNAIGFFSLNRIAEYSTSGFGFIEQTNPLVASKFGLKRDSSLFIPRYAANKTIQEINLYAGLQAPAVKTQEEPEEQTAK